MSPLQRALTDSLVAISRHKIRGRECPLLAQTSRGPIGMSAALGQLRLQHLEHHIDEAFPRAKLRHVRFLIRSGDLSYGPQLWDCSAGRCVEVI